MPGRNKKYRSARSGLALVAVLWVSTIMIALVSVAAQTSLLDSRISQVESERQRCRWAARGGIETAVALLLEDERDYDGLTDLWADNPEELESLSMDGVTLTVRITDAAAKLNANMIDARQWVYLPDATEDITESILDWIDGDDEVRTGGAESGYYLNLDVDYWSRNGMIRTTRELLRVRGVNAGIFNGDPELAPLSADNEGWINYLTCWSRSPNTDSTGGTRVNVNRANAQALMNVGFNDAQARWITQNRPFQSLAELTGKQSSGTSGGSSSAQTAQAQTPSAQTSQTQTSSAQTAQTGAQSSATSSRSGEQTKNNTQSSPSQKNPSQSNQAQNSTAKTGPNNAQTQPPSTPPDWNTVLANIDKLSLVNRPAIQGQLNVNTAEVIVLTAFLEGSRELAEGVIAARESRGGAFMSLSELGQVDGMTETILKKYIDRLTVRSNVFEIVATAVSDATGLRYRVEAVVNRDLSDGQIYYWREGISQ